MLGASNARKIVGATCICAAITASAVGGRAWGVSDQKKVDTIVINQLAAQVKAKSKNIDTNSRNLMRVTRDVQVCSVTQYLSVDTNAPGIFWRIGTSIEGDFRIADSAEVPAVGSFGRVTYVDAGQLFPLSSNGMLESFVPLAEVPAKALKCQDSPRG